eukprot:311831-Amphidinium_carterae.1
MPPSFDTGQLKQRPALMKPWCRLRQRLRTAVVAKCKATRTLGVDSLQIEAFAVDPTLLSSTSA